MIDKKRGLGRGLQDLLSPTDWLKRDDIQLFYCPIDRLIQNPYQPRQSVEDDQLEEMVDSIREKGVLQPILVARTDNPEQYQILAGERRWRASELAGLSEVPVILREASSAEALELALIENIQRRDLNCIEEAMAYKRLQEEFSLTQDEIAKKVGKNRATVANTLRLLQLPPYIQEDILNGALTMGHARALLSVDDPETLRKLRDAVLAQQLSVRQTEKLCAGQNAAQEPPPRVIDPQLTTLQETLRDRLGSKVVLRRKGSKGSITIPFDSEDALERLLKIFGLSV